MTEQSEGGPQLQKGLQQRHMTMISLGGVIGAGLFVGSGAVMNETGPAAILSYLAAGLLVVLVMRMLGEMAVANPRVGSFMEYCREALGDWAGFAVGWLYWYFWAIVLAVEAVAGAEILQNWLPGIPIWVMSLVLMTALTATNLWSVRSFGEFEFWFASIKVAAIIVFIAIGLGWLLGIGGGDSPGLSNLTAHGGFFPEGGVTVLSGVVVVIFAFVGAEIVTIAAAESDEPERAVARATNAVVWRVLIFYVLAVAIVVAIVPWNDTQLGNSPFIAALDVIGIPGAADIMNAIVVTAVLSCLNSGIYTGSRMLFALARRGDAPQAAARDQPPRRAGQGDPADGHDRLPVGHPRRDLARVGVPLAGQLVRRGGAVLLRADRVRGAEAAAPVRARGPRAADAADVVLPVADVPQHRGDGRGHRGDGARRRRARAAVVEPRVARGRARAGVLARAPEDRAEAEPGGRRVARPRRSAGTNFNGGH